MFFFCFCFFLFFFELAPPSPHAHNYSKMKSLSFSGAATKSRDFILDNFVVIISPGSRQSCWTLQINGDEILERNETITLSLSATPEDQSVIVVAPERNEMIITISDDDSK